MTTGQITIVGILFLLIVHWIRTLVPIRKVRILDRTIDTEKLLLATACLGVLLGGLLFNQGLEDFVHIQHMPTTITVSTFGTVPYRVEPMRPSQAIPLFKIATGSILLLAGGVSWFHCLREYL